MLTARDLWIVVINFLLFHFVLITEAFFSIHARIKNLYIIAVSIFLNTRTLQCSSVIFFNFMKVSPIIFFRKLLTRYFVNSSIGYNIHLWRKRSWVMLIVLLKGVNISKKNTKQLLGDFTRKYLEQSNSVSFSHCSIEIFSRSFFLAFLNVMGNLMGV